MNRARRQKQDWYRRNRRAHKARTHAANLRRRYGITLSEYNVKWRAQGGRCAVCGYDEKRQSKTLNRRLCVDHHHLTGQVRGLLCAQCNAALGLLGEDPVTIELLLAYVRKWNVLHDSPARA